MTFYLRLADDATRTPEALYEATLDEVRIWRAGAWHPSARTKSELDGLGGSSDFFPIVDSAVKQWQADLG